MEQVNPEITDWIHKHYVNFAVYNFVLMVLVLLHSAKYFDPYWIISINAIVFAALFLSIVLLNVRSTALFIVSIIFFVFAGLMRLAQINVWADRAGIYVFEAFFLGALMLILENSFVKNKLLRK